MHFYIDPDDIPLYFYENANKIDKKKLVLKCNKSSIP